LETCRLAGFERGSRRCDELVEWDYGDYEGLTDEQAEERQPGWDLFADGAPGGESPDQVSTRVDRLIAKVQDLSGTTLLVGHGKLLRAFAARWIGYEISLGRTLPMDPAAISTLEREPNGPLLRLWNFTGLGGAD
jgi:probable phosphoglycerate mutase